MKCFFLLPQSFKESTLCFVYRFTQPLWKIHGIAQFNFDYFTIDELNQVKSSPELMRFQGYFSCHISSSIKIYQRKFYKQKFNSS